MLTEALYILFEATPWSFWHCWLGSIEMTTRPDFPTAAMSKAPAEGKMSSDNANEAACNITAKVVAAELDPALNGYSGVMVQTLATFAPCVILVSRMLLCHPRDCM